VGALSYLVLFQGSTWYTELVTTGKYPDYAVYQKRVGMFVPGFGNGLKDAWEHQEKTDGMRPGERGGSGIAYEDELESDRRGKRVEKGCTL